MHLGEVLLVVRIQLVLMLLGVTDVGPGPMNFLQLGLARVISGRHLAASEEGLGQLDLPPPAHGAVDGCEPPLYLSKVLALDVQIAVHQLQGLLELLALEVVQVSQEVLSVEGLASRYNQR